MRRKHDGVAGFCGDENFEDRRRGRIRRRDDSADDAARAGNLDYVLRFVDDPDRAQALEVVPHIFSRETILLALVVRDAVAGLFDGHLAEPSRFAQGGLRHRLADTINLALIETCERPLRAMR